MRAGKYRIIKLEYWSYFPTNGTVAELNLILGREDVYESCYVAPSLEMA